MFARIKKSGKYQYLQLVENKREGPKVKQRVLITLGRLDQLNEKHEVESLIKSLSRFSEETLLLLSETANPKATGVKIGPALIFDRLWKQTGIEDAIKKQLEDRAYEFKVERVIFATVLHRLMVSGSDRYCEQWLHDYKIAGVKGIALQHFYRAMAFLGEEVGKEEDQKVLSPDRNKDKIEEALFDFQRDLFSNLEMVFFDTTSIYFEGQGGESLGKRGYSKDSRPDLNQMVVGVILDDYGRPLCCEMWPGNTADVKTMIPIMEKVRKRFKIKQFCIVADRGMISNEILKYLEKPESKLSYILGVRMRRIIEVREDVLSRGGRYREVYPESSKVKDPSPLKVKEVLYNQKRYIVCYNAKQARKDAADREAIVKSLEDKLKQGAKSLVGNKGYQRYLNAEKDSLRIDKEKVQAEERFDGKWVLTTNTGLSSEEVALRYKELWKVEHIFRNMKSNLFTRPIFHKRDDTITGHVFCSFLALVLLKELERRLTDSGMEFHWKQIRQDLQSLQEIIIEEGEKKFVIRTESQGICGKVFQTVGVALPPTIKQI
ncbi:MAG: IS1634 family transposase [Ignavibacteriales bacterium]|nr:IS1634 family transposase [Ignavibacteriales bacterium]